MPFNPLIPMSRSRVGRIAWSLLRPTTKCWDFPAEHERLVTADELLRYGCSVVRGR